MRWLRFPRVLGLVVCAYLLGMTALFGYLATENRRFVHDAGRTEGVVVGLEERAPVGSSRPVRMRTTAPKVSYQVDGTTYTYVAAHGSYRQRFRVGERVTVLYDRSDPAQARLSGEGQVLIPVIVVGFALSAGLVALILLRTRRIGTARSATATGRDPDLDRASYAADEEGVDPDRAGPSERVPMVGGGPAR